MIVRDGNQGVDSWQGVGGGCKTGIYQRLQTGGGGGRGRHNNRLLYVSWCCCSKFRPRAPRLFSKVQPAVSQQKPASGLRGRA